MAPQQIFYPEKRRNYTESFGSERQSGAIKQSCLAAAASTRADSHGPGIIPPGTVCNRNFFGELPLLDLWWH